MYFFPVANALGWGKYLQETSSEFVGICTEVVLLSEMPYHGEVVASTAKFFLDVNEGKLKLEF